MQVGEFFSSQYGNTAAFLSHSSLLQVISTLVVFLETEAWLPHVQACLSLSAVLWPMNFVDLWWCRTLLSWVGSSLDRLPLHSRRTLSDSL